MASEGSGDAVLVDTAQLNELLTRLQDRKAAVEKECNRLPPAPKGKDMFHLCRGFERAFSHVVESTDYAATIRRAFQHDGLQGAVDALPLERRFKLSNVKDVVRESDGYQGHLVSPEMGLRRMVDETLALVVDPVSTAVRRVHQVLIDAAREASKKASLMTDTTTLDPTRESLKLPAFEQTAMLAVTKALELWRDEALNVARTIVTMEQSYVTAAFFRHLTVDRHRQRVAALYDEGHQQLVSGDGVAAEDQGDSDSDDETDASELDGYAASNQPKREDKPALAQPRPAAQPDQGDLKTGYLEKRIGEKSGRQNLPESMKWQKRYFVLAEPKGMLYYFKSVDDPPHYKGVINIRDAKVEDVDVDGLPKASNKSKYDLDGGGGQVSLLIRLSHKNPAKPLVKNHQSIVLRAESASEKYAWLARLKYTSEGIPGAVRSYDSTSLLDGARTGNDELGRLGLEPKPAQEKKEKRPSKPPPSQGPHSSYGGTPNADHNVTASGIGSAMTFDEDAGIGPEPILFSRNFGGMPNPGGTTDPHVFDEFLTQLGEDVAAYVRTVCHTIVLTVPKAIIHCQVKRAQTHLLEHLYSHINSMANAEGDGLLDEDPQTAQRRAAGKASLQEMNDALKALTRMQEEATGDKVPVPAHVLELAGSHSQIPANLRSTRSGRYGEYTPTALQGSYANENGNYRTSSGAPPRRSTSNSSERGPPPPSTSRLSNVLPSMPQMQMPSMPQMPQMFRRDGPAPPPSSRPTGPPDLSQPSPMPRRRPPPAPGAGGPPPSR